MILRIIKNNQSYATSFNIRVSFNKAEIEIDKSNKYRTVVFDT